MPSFAEATAGDIKFTGYGESGFTTRAFPVPESPRPASTEYGEIFPGRTNIGSVGSPDNGMRFKELLYKAAEYTTNAYGNVLAAGTQKKTQQLTKGKGVDRSFINDPSTTQATDISGIISNNRQLIIIGIAAILFVVILSKAKMG
jgi:hypothetical protein